MIDAKRKALIFLTIAFVLAVITSVLILSQIRAAQDSLGERTQVAVAATDIQTYTEITEDMIEWVEIPQVDNLGSFVRDTSEIEGTIAVVNMQQGDLLTSNVLRAGADIPEDHRIVWMNATSNVVMDQPVASGDTVDIIVTYDTDEEFTTTRLFENVTVVQREDGGEGMSDIKVSMPLSDAERFIHHQNTADSIRILLANQVQQPGIEDEQEEVVEEEQPEEEPEEEEEPEDEPEDEDEDEEEEDDENEDEDDE
ncbi:Flp pilus assembly protein CpaB [Alteribacter aurantiacus]|uniref:Flp pilus assembly protein CpaB n=1 Tax=Alteribacter aurantiacus TaxID=254410 RepID=UPI00042513E9|nr:SAF domain-containing protein [Alteribacter aurantiacus]